MPSLSPLSSLGQKLYHMVLQAEGGNKGYNLLIRVVAVVFVYSIKTRRRFQYISSIGKIYVITLYLEDIYGRYCIQKSINDHFRHILT